MNRPFVIPTAILVALSTGLFGACQSSNDDATSPESVGAQARQEARPAEMSDEENGAVGGIGSRVFVVERASSRLSIYDFRRRELLDRKIEGLGNLRHATMTFSPDLRYGFLATRNGKLSRIDLRTLEVAGQIQTSENSIDIAISQDGRYIATAEYEPGGVTILDAAKMEVLEEIPTFFEKDGVRKRSRATGIVDAAGNRLVFSLMEGNEVWVVDANTPSFEVIHRIPVAEGMPYDAMITPDGRYYVVGHLHKDYVSLIDLEHPDEGARKVSLQDPERDYDAENPVKLPHMASWAVARDHIFVPLVGQERLAVLDRYTWEYVRSIPLRGDPVYAVRSPAENEVWVSFSGDEDDAWVQVVDTESLEVTEEIEVGGRIYHMDFTPRGAHVLVSCNEAEELALVDADDYRVVDRQKLDSPSGVFGVWRAFQIGL